MRETVLYLERAMRGESGTERRGVEWSEQLREGF